MARRISPEQGAQYFAEGIYQFIDIRDPASFAAGHIRGSRSLTHSTVDEFLVQTDREQPLVVYCYHGNSSQQASDWLHQQGFSQVVSLDGGYEVFRQHYADYIEETA